MPLIYGEGRENALNRLRRKIDKSTGHELASLPTTLPSTYKELTPIASCNVPFRRDPDFVDRGTLLDQIHEKLSGPSSLVALVGLGGVG